MTEVAVKTLKTPPGILVFHSLLMNINIILINTQIISINSVINTFVVNLKVCFFLCDVNVTEMMIEGLLWCSGKDDVASDDEHSDYRECGAI